MEKKSQQLQFLCDFFLMEFLNYTIISEQLNVEYSFGLETVTKFEISLKNLYYLLFSSETLEKIKKTQNMSKAKVDLEYKNKRIHLLYSILFLKSEKKFLIGIKNLSLQNDLIEFYVKIKNESLVDSTTNLMNRRSFNKIILDKKLSVLNTKKQWAFAFIDIDNFKKLNDTYGHLAGDLVLEKFGKVLLASTRGSDMCFRYGGEEFVVVIFDCAENNIRNIATRICENVRNMFVTFENYKLRITVSIGIQIGSNHSTFKEALEKADEKLYFAKNSGKDKFCL
jgi:diguanylate cyclase (GGDEF)-like protein